jgi:hypothetical protein
MNVTRGHIDILTQLGMGHHTVQYHIYTLDTLFYGPTGDGHNPFICRNQDGCRISTDAKTTTTTTTTHTTTRIIRMIQIRMVCDLGYNIIFGCQSYRNDTGRFFHILDI